MSEGGIARRLGFSIFDVMTVMMGFSTDTNVHSKRVS